MYVPILLQYIECLNVVLVIGLLLVVDTNSIYLIVILLFIETEFIRINMLIQTQCLLRHFLRSLLILIG